MKNNNTAVSPIMRNIAVVVFIMAMAAAADLCGQHEVIFPEAGALCVGLWLMPKAVWNVRMWQVPVYLTAAALMGLAVNRFVPACFEIRFALAFIVIFVLLRLVKCNMYPLVSASMLPMLIGTTSWVYPVSVLALSMLIAVGRKWLPQEKRDEYQPYGALKTVLLVVALCIPLAVVRWAKFSPMQYLVVPPLVVTMIEFANRISGPGNEQDERNTSANHWKVIINRINTALHGSSRKTAMKQSISASRWG